MSRDDLAASVWAHRTLVSIEYQNIWFFFSPEHALMVAGLLMDAADQVIAKRKETHE